jgi:beta-aspartyl-peptidase (threonine type)
LTAPAARRYRGAVVPALIAHGGAGADPGDRAVYRDALGQALQAGWARLVAGGSALDGVEACVAAMEAHPRFNAGYGSALTEAGTVECDASIMDGERLDAGAVGAVSGVVSPIGLARRVLEDGRDILLVGEGARAFARERGVPLCDPADLVTEHQRRRLAERLAGRAPVPAPGGTVGAVAIDRRGVIAAGTSTGGLLGKRVGRVGDSALIGAGTYADNRLGGVSTTGQGEAFIRTALARTAVDILVDLDDPELAAQVAMDVLREDGRGDGGLVLLDWRGRLGHACCTPFMPVGWCLPTGPGPVLAF